MTNREAISIITQIKGIITNANSWDDVAKVVVKEAFDLACKVLEERPQGEWGKWVISEIRCPNCLEYFQTDCYSTEELNKCPNCGADMRGAK